MRFCKLRRFRAGIEGCISTLERTFGMSRASWRGDRGFESYVWARIVSFDAVILAGNSARRRTTADRRQIP